METLMTAEDATRIEKRVDKMDERLEAFLKLMNDIYTDVKFKKCYKVFSVMFEFDFNKNILFII